MTDKSELKLAEGSRWGDGTYGDAIIDDQGTEIETDGPDLHVDGVPCKFLDALAAIRAVDGDPEYLERNRLRAHLARLGYDELQISRIATGDEVESDYYAPQTIAAELDKCAALKERDEFRAENEALVARCESLRNDLDEHKSWLEDAQRERDYFEELANNAGVT